MKTVEIVKNLLEFSYTFDHCPDCGIDLLPESKHKEDCKFVKTQEAAREYLRLMNPAKEK